MRVLRHDEPTTARKPWLAAAWRALVGLTLAATEAAPRSDVPRLAETVAAGRDHAAPMAV